MNNYYETLKELEKNNHAIHMKAFVGSKRAHIREGLDFGDVKDLVGNSGNQHAKVLIYKLVPLSESEISEIRTENDHEIAKKNAIKKELRAQALEKLTTAEKAALGFM